MEMKKNRIYALLPDRVNSMANKIKMKKKTENNIESIIFF